MTNNIVNILTSDIVIKSNDKITETLSKYTEKTINKDKSVIYTEISTAYFLENDKWNINFFSNIEQFEKQVDDYKFSTKNILFPFNNKNLNKEIKFIVYSKLFSEEWNLTTIFTGHIRNIKVLVKFVEEKYPHINSLLELGSEKTNIQWLDWLEKNNINIITKHKKGSKLKGENYYIKTSIANFLDIIIKTLKTLIDIREEWEKDKWDVRNLEKYGINYVKSSSTHYINLSKINNAKIKKEIKKYLKQKLIANNNFSWGSAINYVNYTAPFINYICELEPDWNELKDLKRKHIEKYLQYLNIYAKENCNRKNSNKNQYVLMALRYVRAFLADIQMREYDFAPRISIKVLILPEDFPTIVKKSNDQIDYVPNYILEQLFKNINNLSKEYIPVVYVMFKTGLRISDALSLKQGCLVKLNNKFWLDTNIEKTYIKGHRIPIDDELANMLAVLIDTAKKNSNEDNNPEKYIFVRYKGSRKGRPFGAGHIAQSLNLLAIDCNIIDESGNRFHFNNHAFRHTYAIKLLNNGVDIFTVQELLAHASPEMTMRYAKLLDDTKRKVFDKAVKQGIFSFDESDKLKEENNGEIPSDIIDMLYTNHKLNALDTPYGTCMQRKNGKCSYAKQPPCLTCNNGSPCKDLCVGAFEGDINKYEILINSTKTMIENAKMYNRTEMVSENEELLKLYKDIYSKISQGSMIYSSLDKLKKKVD